MQGLLTLIIVCVVLSERNSIYRLICFSSPLRREGEKRKLRLISPTTLGVLFNLKGCPLALDRVQTVRGSSSRGTRLSSFLHSTSGQHLISSPNTSTETVEESRVKELTLKQTYCKEDPTVPFAFKDSMIH